MINTTFVILLFGFATAEVGNHNKLVVRTINGLIRGTEDKAIDGKVFYSFKGIPFAEPPVEKLRFLEPKEPRNWEGVVNANQWSNMCLQTNMWTNLHDGSEDCLYLNVFSPVPSEHEQRLPVMIYIHGGAFRGGAASEHLPNILMRDGIVLVVIQYRLGIFGFLSTEDNILPGNMGIKDQRMAMQWVQNNIGNFGGDKNRVTIFGESAGGASVHIHVLSPGSAGLFHNAISQSGTALCPWATSTDHRQIAQQIGHSFNCTLQLSSKAYLKCLQSVDGPSLLKIVSQYTQFGLSPPLWTPRVDGDILPEAPETLLREGKFNQVNFISGINRDEGAPFFIHLLLRPENMQNLIGNFSFYGPLSMFLSSEADPLGLAVTVYNKYLNTTVMSLDNARESVKLISDRYFIMGHDFASLFHAKHSIGSSSAFYTYELNCVGQYSTLQLFKQFQALSQYWVGHADDLYYLFELEGPLGSIKKLSPERAQYIEMSRFITKMWTNFAKTGNPTPNGLYNFKWERTTADNFKHLDLTLCPKMEPYKRSQEMMFWSSLNLRENKLMFPKGQVASDLPVLRRTPTWPRS